MTYEDYWGAIDSRLFDSWGGIRVVHIDSLDWVEY